MVPENVPKLKVSQPPIFRALAVSFKGGQCLPVIQGSLHWLAIIPIQVDTPPETNMTLEISISNRKYIFKWWMFHCHVSFFLGGGSIIPTLVVAFGSIFLPIKLVQSLYNPYLVGGFNPFEKYACQIGSFSPSSRVENKKSLSCLHLATYNPLYNPLHNPTKSSSQ